MDNNKSLEVDEKVDIKEIRGNDTREEREFLENLPLDRKKNAVRKLDVRILPTFLVLYIASHLDRANIGNAKIEGMEGDLGMSGADYNLASGIFFLPFILFEMPSNFVLRHYFKNSPSLWIGFIATSWGTVMTLTGIVQNLTGLVIARVFLGAAEAGFFPAAIMLLTTWYEKRELQTRISILYIASSLSGAVSGLLAFAIAKMDGTGGLEGWRWIFILEGLATVLIAFITSFTLPDTPDKSKKWLSEDEIKFFKYRVIMEEGKNAEVGFSWRLVRSVVLDWKIWLFGLIYCSAGAPMYAVKFTLPEILTTMGFESQEAQLLSMPPYFVGGLTSLISSVIADRIFWRMPFVVGPQVLIIVGFIVLAALPVSENIAACYFCICLVTAGIFPLVPGANAWASNNLAGPEKRSLGIALYISIGNVGSIAGSFMFMNSESPRFPTGYGVGIGIVTLGALVGCFLEFVFWKTNKKNANSSIEEVHAMYSDEELAFLGDRSPLYKHTL